MDLVKKLNPCLDGVVYTNPLSLRAATPVLIAVAMIDNAKNKVVKSSSVAAAPVTLPLVADATWFATVGIKLTPTMIVMNPPIIFPRKHYIDRRN